MLRVKDTVMLKHDMRMSGLTISTLAEAVERSVPYVSRIINGSVSPSAKTAKMIADVISNGCSKTFQIDDIFLDTSVQKIEQ